MLPFISPFFKEAYILITYYFFPEIKKIIIIITLIFLKCCINFKYLAYNVPGFLSREFLFVSCLWCILLALKKEILIPLFTELYTSTITGKRWNNLFLLDLTKEILIHLFTELYWNTRIEKNDIISFFTLLNNISCFCFCCQIYLVLCYRLSSKVFGRCGLHCTCLQNTTALVSNECIQFMTHSQFKNQIA